MKTYMLFLFGNFEDHEDIEYFCMDVLGESKSISSLKYVIDNLKNIIIIFDSDIEKTKMVNEIDTLLNNESILFYFLFEKTSLLSSYIPDSMANLIFKPSSSTLKIELNRVNEKNLNLNLDDVLDKIKKLGIESLTPDEKKFLDNFEN